jgi:acetyl-CoA carboxylase biotin carboxyl carrier protein
MPLTHGDVRRILDTFKHSSDLDYLEVTIGDSTLRASKSANAFLARPGQSATLIRKTENTAANAAATAPTPTGTHQEENDEAAIIDGGIAIRAPMAGTFYRNPNINEPPYVIEGDTVAEGETVCLIEVMKLFSSVRSSTDGRIDKILVENAKSVVRDQILMIVAANDETIQG